MASVNKVILVGNLGKDPEVRKMPSGDSVANLIVATSESWTKDGEKNERTEWHNVVIFGKLAEIAERYLRKGSKIYVEGSLQTRKWRDQSGQDKYTTEVVLRGFGSSMVMLDGRGGEGGGSGGGGGYDNGPVMDRGQSSRDERQGSSYTPNLDDEVPFGPCR